MNVAKKSTTKLPQNWQHGGTVPAEGKDEEADSGVGSADSVDFQDALLNLKALNGASCGVSACESIQTNLCKENDLPAERKAETVSADTSSLLRENNDEKDILEQIDDVVNDRPSRKVLANGTSFDKVGASKVDQETEEDDILILSPDESETKRELKLLETSGLKGKGVSGNGAHLKNSLKIGEKVRSKVHTIMSKFVQNNPVVNNLLTKAKSVHSEDSDGPGGGSSPASPSVFRQDKGNLFDNFEVTDTKSPQSASSNCQLPAVASHNTESSSLHNLPKEADQGHLDEHPSVESAMAVLPPESCDNSHTGEESASSVVERTESKPNCVELGQDSDVPLHSNAETLHTESRPDFTVESNFTLEGKVTESETDKEAKCDEIEVTAKREIEIGTKCENDITAKCENANKAKCEGDTVSIVTGSSIADCCKGNSKLTVAQTACHDAGTAAVQEESMDTSKLVKSDRNTCDQLTKNVIGDDVETSFNGQVTERKRQHSQDAVTSDSGDSHDSAPGVAKRSRLDGLIGKLGERVSFTSETPENDAFEDDDSTPGDTDSVEKQSEELISYSASDEEEEKTPSPDSGAKVLLTRQELEKLIIQKVAAAVQQYQSQEILQLNRRIEELVQSSEEWRSKAKELQSQMLELTILQQKLDKRKAHTAALKSITTRSIGVGVTEDRLRTQTPQKASGTKTPPATPPAVSQAPPTFTSSQRLPAPAAAQTVASRNTSVAHLLSQTAHMPTVASCQAAAVAKAAVGKPIDTSGRLAGGVLLQNQNTIFRGQSITTVPASNVVLVNSATGLPVVTSSTAQSVCVASRVTTSSRDLIDLTGEDEANATKQSNKQPPGVAGQVRALGQAQVVRQVTPLSQGMPVASSAILFSTPSGTQIVNANNVPRPGLLQLVTLANGTTLKPGQFITMVPGQSGAVLRPATTLTTNSTPPRFIAQAPPGAVRLVPPHLLPGNATTVRVTVPAPPSAAPRLTSAVAVPAAPPALTTAARGTQHPAPLPAGLRPTSTVPSTAKLPPLMPCLKISRVKQGIVLSWNMSLTNNHAEVSNYQLYAYQETGSQPLTSLWKKVGDVSALALPMACTLTQFQDGNKYHFAVRAVDIYGRSGPFSDPSFIHLTKIP